MKKLFLILTILLSSFQVQGQEKNQLNEMVTSSIDAYCQKETTESHYDVDSILTCIFDENLPIGHNVKYFLPIYPSSEIRYNGGGEKMRQFMDKLWYQQENYEELNASALYCILFDKNLKIIDIRILKRNAYDNSKRDYDKIVKDIIRATEGHWHTLDNNKSEYYFTIGHFSMR